MRTQWCFEELIDYYYEYDKQRVKQYVRDERGWSPDMVDEFNIGWADPDANAYNYLAGEGYTHEEIISTGAFTESGDPLWNGRYVFPYFNKRGNPCYAIARTTGNKGGGAAGYDGHEEDFIAGKYAKLAHSKEYVEVDEPIWGLHCVDHTTDFVIIAEGIADAMILDYHGFPVLSPVTTTFKEKHFDPLVQLFEDNWKDEVYIIPDSEEVQEKSKYGVSAGFQGALSSAYQIYQRISELDVKIAQIPRQDGVRKIDVDDFLTNHDREELQQILIEAREATEWDAYDEIASSQSTSADEDYDEEEIQGTDKSAIYELKLSDILPSGFGDRGENPISHTGSSENYFVLIEDGETAYDHKRDVTYNAITYLLCKCGERNVDDPEGSLSNQEVWKAWKHAKENGVIGEDDPVPVRAMRYHAERLDFEVSDDGILNANVYNNVVSAIDDEVNSGREQIENSAREFYKNQDSDYYDMEVSIAKSACSVVDELNEFTSLDIVWTCEETTGYLPTLALVALQEEYISTPIEPSWASELTDIEFANLCLDAKNKYLFNGTPPFRAIRGSAMIADYIKFEGELDRSEYQAAKEFFLSA
ncbi:hypothetical protein BRD22_07595 [Halobacteriales archaeon SW_8_68_21]|nr:MAG: hypothetical protein BRD22_07595 [Halobacteriales archaeon SW_8_68_21]